MVYLECRLSLLRGTSEDLQRIGPQWRGKSDGTRPSILTSSQDLTLWEQMDNGAEFTPAKKYLTAVPVVLWVFPTLLKTFCVLTLVPSPAFLLPAITHD